MDDIIVKWGSNEYVVDSNRTIPDFIIAPPKFILASRRSR